MPANLKIKIGCTPQELTQAMKLRYQVFHREIKGLPVDLSIDELDRDEFDEFCEHLVIIDTNRDVVIGTYRMLLGSVARRNIGYYSDRTFELSKIDQLEGEKLEVGRACVERELRHGYVLNLLWSGITKYCISQHVRYIFGSANILTSDPHRISQFVVMFRAMNLINDLGITPRDPSKEIIADESVTIGNPREVFKELPTLFKGYMQVGLKICGNAVRDEFGTAVFPVLLDLKNVNQIYRKRFLGNYLLDEEPVGSRS